MTNVIEKIEGLKIEKSSTWIAEARFGHRHIRTKIKHLKSPATILEIGCGSGILLSMLAEEFRSHSFSGIEPFAAGFDSSKELNEIVKEHGLDIRACDYESYDSDQKFDLIYCVNVLEHVKDWRYFLEWASASLSDNGVFVFLCPNYSFPYESHFALPIIINKKITFKIFGKYIRRFEVENSAVGLWESLNFVKKREIKNFIEAREHDLYIQHEDDLDIVADMVSRIRSDVDFRKRHRFTGGLAILLGKIGFFEIFKLVPNFLPYMKIEIRKVDKP